MERKKIKVFGSFEELDQDQLEMNIESSLEERWESYWKLRRFHRLLFREIGEDIVYPEAVRKLILYKPMDVEDVEFLRFVKAAAENKLEYMLIGGLALAMNGIARYTQDADVWIRPTKENKERFVKTLMALSYEEDEIARLREVDFQKAQHIRLAGPIDVMTVVHFRMEYDTCRSRAREFLTVEGLTIHFIHINDLRELKILARRPKDLHDVLMIDELLEKLGKRLDGGD
ncbi:hypothetical protein SAMN04487996_12477 [Dyadobacter soli]|uniref:Nucleotidyl transferase AbiEii toxin, Type IV TA system n=1 Tax=Dyadobacter soli TaxID=659014 RepID=A0A1G7XQ75_9BACT|nr:hypothetical protein [Dyadobacter soli]SDG86337.1 hypothetical protein SAMN04487996_12477 [Dyadobacter soli]